MTHGLMMIISPDILEDELMEHGIPPIDDNVAVDSNISETLINQDTGTIAVGLSDTEIELQFSPLSAVSEHQTVSRNELPEYNEPPCIIYGEQTTCADFELS